MQKILNFLCILLLALTLCPAPACAADSAKLLKVVVLSRHGVRSPTQSGERLQSWSRKAWPEWPVKAGELTDRGAELVDAMWTNLRELFEQRELLTPGVCPDPVNILVRADVDERTRATAQAILDGLAPNCPLDYQVADASVDPLFHPVKANLTRFDPIRTASNVISMVPGGLDNLEDELASSLAILEEIAGPPSEKLCNKFTSTPNCRLSELPNAISVSSTGESVHIIGALSIASSMAEIFLLEYAQWPGRNSGWGQVNAGTLGRILPIHARVFDVVNRAPQVAFANGAPLLRQISQALSGTHPDPAYNEARLVVFVGHDTNIANLGGLLGAQWQAQGYPANGIPPGSAIFFELWERNGQKYVTLTFRAQPLEALHASFPKNRPDSWAANAFPQDSRPDEALERFAPERAIMNRPPQEGMIMIDLAEFQGLVDKAVQGAPVIGAQNLKSVHGFPLTSPPATERASQQ